MKKIKITQEQAYAIQIRIDENRKGLMLNHHANGWVGPINGCLNDLSVSQLARALYVGYEVEPEFKIGDWVVFKYSCGHEAVGKITKFHPRNDEHAFLDAPLKIRDDGFVNVLTRALRHATPEEIATEKQRRFFAKNNRGVWELRKGDLLGNKYTNHEVSGVENDGEYIKFKYDGCCRNLHFIQENYRVACFAEDRQDLGGN